MARVLVPLPDRDFDPTEAAVPWHVLRAAGHEVVFATEHGGAAPACDPRALNGIMLGRFGADRRTKELYAELERDSAFTEPVAWSTLDVRSFDGLILPGGHAPGMRQYLGSHVLHERVAAFWRLGRPVGAICHGVVVLARSGKDGHGLLVGRRTTAFPAPMERAARLGLFWLGDYTRTSPRYVEDEVREALGVNGRFERGPRVLLARGSEHDDRPAFVLVDGAYVSARWLGDAWLFARTLAGLLPGA